MVVVVTVELAEKLVLVTGEVVLFDGAACLSLGILFEEEEEVSGDEMGGGVFTMLDCPKLKKSILVL